MVEKIAGGILGIRVCIDDVLVRTIVQRSDINSLLRASGVIGSEEEEMLAVGQEPGPAVGGVFVHFKLSQTHRNSAGGADAPQGIAVVGLVNDDVVLVPRTPARVG